MAGIRYDGIKSDLKPVGQGNVFKVRSDPVRLTAGLFDDGEIGHAGRLECAKACKVVRQIDGLCRGGSRRQRGDHNGTE